MALPTNIKGKKSEPYESLFLGLKKGYHFKKSLSILFFIIFFGFKNAGYRQF